MANPTLQEILDGLQAAKQKLDELLAGIEAKVPGILAPELIAIHAVIDSILTPEALASLTESLKAALDALKQGKSELGSGANADLS